MINTHMLGVKGEQLACDYLVNNGYKILHKNYECSIGEIDIIAKQKNVIVFVEVKQRSSTKFGFPREAVTKHKAHKIRLVAEYYLKCEKITSPKVRFDCIEVLGEEITHIENCF